MGQYDDALAPFLGMAPTASVGPQEAAGSFLSEHPWLTGLGAAAGVGGALLLRRPGLLEAVKELAASSGKALASKLPKELPLLRKIPDSPVVSLTEKHATNYAKALEDVITGPLSGLMPEGMGPTASAWERLKGLGSTVKPRVAPQQWIEAEDKAYQAYKTLGATPEAKAAGSALLTPEMKQAAQAIEAMRPEELAAAKYLGERALEDVPHLYIPRILQKDFDNVVKVGGYAPALKSDIRSTLGAFEKARVFPTMKEGIAAGEEYLDPSQAILYRAQSGLKMIHTAKFIKELEDAKVIFRTPDAARAVADEAVKLDGVPGVAKWYARSKLEAQFLADQLENPRATGLGLNNLVQQSNRIFRNPNLMNPLPHLTKNMLFKYGWSGGDITKVFSDAREFATRANPELLARFNKVMPFTETGKTGTDVLLDAVAAVKGSKLSSFRRVLEAPNNWSSRLVFAKFDPWLRYSRWKQYVGKGMGDQEAANNVWLDLIRYGTRSDLVDFWKSIPLNFFVPWRVGTITSLWKNLTADPVRAGLFLGGVDLMKETLYRKTGWWFHTPSDYVEAPIVRLIEGFQKKPQAGASTAAGLAMTTALFGPGGEHSDRLIQNVLKTVDKGSVEYKQLVGMFWGLASVADPYGVLPTEVMTFMKDHDPKHLVHVFQNVALGAHNALNYRPRRLLEFLPDSMMSKTEKVQQAEALQNRRDVTQEHKTLRPYRSISERIGDD